MINLATAAPIRAQAISPQQAGLDGSSLCSPRMSPPASAQMSIKASGERAASFDLFDKLAARHAGLMGRASLKLALEKLVSNDSGLTDNNTFAHGMRGQ